MTKRNGSTSNAQNSAAQRSLLAGLSLLGSMGMLSGGIALAQTAAPDAGVPSAEDLMAPAAVVEPPAPAAPARPEPVRRAPVRQAPVQATSPEPAPVRRNPEPAPAAAEPSAPAISAPTAPAAAAPSPAAVQRSVSTPEIILPPSAGRNTPSPSSSDLYIDPTSYQLGATEAKPGVVFTERATGCQTVLQPGQNVPTRICGGGSGSSNGTVATREGNGGTTAQYQDNGDGVNIGPVRISRNGVSINPASLEAFYNRTLRPLALPGNGNASLMFPLTIPSAITSAFGWRVHPITGDRRFHAGTDLGAPMGTPVVAAYSGRVNTAGFVGGYGLTVILSHNQDREQTLYAHMSEIFVRPGAWIDQGEVIGRVGSTGNSTGPHLHFEFRERTSQGWVAMDAGQVLQHAIGNISQGFRIAQVPSGPKDVPTLTAAPAIEVKGLQDFGKLAGSADPATEADLPTVTVQKTTVSAK